LTEGSLVDAVRQGEDEAFGELYRRHQPEVARFVRARIRDQGRAEDVTQDAFLSALRRLRQTDGDVAFRPWMFEIARNATIDCYRRSSRTEEVSIDADAMQAADAGRLPGGPQPELSLVTQESFASLREAMHELSDVHRRAIVLRELEGRSYREIGARLDLGQAAVESTLFRARRSLEREYTELDSGRRCRLVGAAIGRLAEGLESDRDRQRLDRHARRCSSCRRRARTLGVEPMLGRRTVAARAAALMPLPVFLRRRFVQDAAAAGDAGHGTSAALAPAVEVVSGAGGKALALLVTAVFVGGGGATLGGAGPLAPAGQPQLAPAVTPASDTAPGDPAARDRPSADRAPQPAPAEASTREAPEVPRDADAGLPRRARPLDPAPRTVTPEPATEPGPSSPAAPDAPSADVPDVPGAPSPPRPPSAPGVPDAPPSPSEAITSAPVEAVGSAVARVQGS